MKRNRLVEREIPEGMYALATRRVNGFLRHTAAMAQHGSIDLQQLARASYLQGIHDAFQVAESCPEAFGYIRSDYYGA